MPDFLKEYKREKWLSIFWIIWVSLVLALWINFFVLDTTDIGKNLKASILDVNNVWSKADFFLETNWNTIKLKASKTMQKPTNVSVSIAYNPEKLEVSDITTDLWDLIKLGVDDSGYQTFMINMDWTKDIVADSNVITITPIKKDNISTQINLVDANFIDNTWETYKLTTSGITF